MRPNNFIMMTASAFLLLTACDQKPSPSQAVADCLSSPGCPATIVSTQGASNPYGQLTPIGTNATGPTLAATPALANAPAVTGNPVTVLNAKPDQNSFKQSAQANAAVNGGSIQAGIDAGKAADQQPAYGPRVTSAAELGSDPSESGAAGAR